MYTVDGKWGPYGSPYGGCDNACKTTRKRLCNNPAPRNGGAKCIGGNGDVQTISPKCNSNICGNHLQNATILYV